MSDDSLSAITYTAPNRRPLWMLASVVMMAVMAVMVSHPMARAAFCVMAAVTTVMAFAMQRLMPLRIRIGTDGVLVGRAYVPFSELESLIALDEVWLKLHNGKKVSVPAATNGLRTADEVMEAIETRRNVFKVHTPIDKAEHFARAGRTANQWYEELRNVLKQGYRKLEITRDELWAIVENPTSPCSARLGAAVALQAEPEERDRMKTVATATADPYLEMALRMLAAEKGPEEVTRKFASVAPPEA